MSAIASTPFPSVPRRALQYVLLACGIVSSVLYVATDLLLASRWPGYSLGSQAISELSAIDAPTQSLWRASMSVYNLLLVGFAIGIWQASAGRRAVQVTAGLVASMVLIGIVWSFFPMHLRDAPKSATDAVHAIIAAVQVVVTLVAIVVARNAAGRAFRIYSLATVGFLLSAGAATFALAPRLGVTSTAGMGLLERVNVYGYLLWMAMLAMVLMRTSRKEGLR